MKHSAQSGNILIIILITIALLGSVTAMITRSGSSTNETGDYERSAILASKIIAHAKDVELALNRLLQRGCSENQISFYHSSLISAASYINPNSPPDLSCHIYEEAGGGIVFYQDLSNPQIYDKTNTYAERLRYPSSATNHEDAGIDTNMDFNFLFIDIQKDLCIAINQLVGVTNTGGNPPDSTSQAMGGSSFAGTFGPTYGGKGAGNRQIRTAETENKFTGCVEFGLESPPDTIFVFYHVMHKR